jgi:sugar/nucleoside kinase (ribokinase family)
VAINAREAARWCGAGDALGVEAPAHAAAIHAGIGQPVFVTRGADGLVAADAAGVHEVAGIALPPPIDPVGAGDAVTAAVAAALGAGCDVKTAARLANLAAAVTVTKLRATGTASPDEIRALAARHGAS